MRLSGHHRSIGRALLVAASALTFVIATPAPSVGATATVHVVKPGETLSGIARRYHCEVRDIRRTNHLKGDIIKAGARLKLPSRCQDTPTAKDTRKTVRHVVLSGETLGGIADRYGVTVDEIMGWNRKKIGKKGLIRIGHRLQIKTHKKIPERHRFTYKIRPGDTLSRIAKRYGLTVTDITRLNPKKKAKHLQIGDRINLYREGPAVTSHAVGRPQAGQLINGEQLPKGPGYYIRRPHRAWGTNETIAKIISAVSEVRAKHPKAHDLAIGDISSKTGGKLAKHVSHQTGRDVDLGYYFTNQPRTGPKAFIRTNRHPVDFAATWTLLQAFAGKTRRHTQVEYMFMTYGMQRRFYKWAEANGVKKATLDWMFQYPRGSRAMKGLIRHEPGHGNHVHIRFKCPKGDNECI